MDLTDKASAVLSHLIAAPDAYLHGTLDREEPFQLLDNAAEASASESPVDPDVVRELLAAGLIETFALGFRMPAKVREQLRPR